MAARAIERGQTSELTPDCVSRIAISTPELLREAFGDMTIDLLESYDAEIHEGVGHSGISALVDLFARKGDGT